MPSPVMKRGPTVSGYRRNTAKMTRRALSGFSGHLTRSAAYRHLRPHGYWPRPGRHHAAGAPGTHRAASGHCQHSPAGCSCGLCSADQARKAANGSAVHGCISGLAASACFAAGLGQQRLRASLAQEFTGACLACRCEPLPALARGCLVRAGILPAVSIQPMPSRRSSTP